MPTSTTGISTAKFVLDFNPVHIGQNFIGVDRRKFTLAFHKVGAWASYKLAISTSAFALSFKPAVGRIDEKSSIIPASFTFLTSRTSPAEPQPFIARVNEIPQVIV